MIIFNVKIVFVINGRDFSSDRFPQPPGIFCHIVLSLGCVAWKLRHIGKILKESSMLAFMLVPHMNSRVYSHVFSMPIWFMYSWFRIFPWSDADVSILLPFIAIPSIIMILSLYEQYGCRNFFTSALIDGQPHNTYSDSIHRCSSPLVTDLISSALMHDSMAFMVMFIPCNILCGICDVIITSFWRLPPAVCDTLLCWLHRWNSSDLIFLGHEVCLGLLFQCFHIRFQCWSGYCLIHYWP